MSAKNIPQRMCVACRQMKNKKDLIRVVRTPEGQTILDKTGKKAGRGAYICPDETCLQKAFKTKALERILKTAIDQETWESIRDELAPSAGEGK